MFFLVKCIFWLGLVLALMAWRGDAGDQPAKRPAVAKAATQERRTPAVAPESAAATLARAARDKLSETARAQCLARPADCLALIGAAARMQDKRDAR